MIFIMYALIVVIIVYLSINLANYVDLLDKKSNLSGAFIGGIMLAAATSLPEFFTSISAATVIKNTTLIMGNIFGSNIFNLTIIGALTAVSAKKFNEYHISKNYKFNTLTVLLITIITLILPDVFILGINLKSIIIIVLYCAVLKILGSEDGTDVDNGELSEKEKNISLRKIYVMFGILSVCIICTSFALTYTSDMISKKINLDASVAGALLLGIATSLPELVSSIQLFKIGNMNAVYGNIIGSNLFNLTILSVTDILSKDNVYIMSKATVTLIVLNILGGIIPYVLLKLKSSNYKKYMLYRIIGLLNVVFYVVYVVSSV